MIKTKHKKTKSLNSGGRHKSTRFKFLSTWNFTIALISVLVLAFYLWTEGSNGVPLIVDIGPEEYFKQVPTPCLFPDISPHSYRFYNLLADAFEARRLHLSFLFLKKTHIAPLANDKIFYTAEPY